MKTNTIMHYFSYRPTNKAVRILGVCLLMLVAALPLSAQVYSTAQSGNRYDARQDMQYNGYGMQEEMQPTYNPYQSTVYQPFGSSMPSGSNPSYISSSSSNMGTYNPIRGRRNSDSAPTTTDTDSPNLENGTTVDNSDGGLQGGGDPGWQGGSPVGEAWVMLFFAAAAALVVFVRQRKAAVRG